MTTQPFPRINFSAGELTPRLQARQDVETVSHGASHLKNMIVTPFGGLERRRGTRLVYRAGKDAGGIRLIPFMSSENDQLLLELGAGYMRFIMESGPLLSPTGTPLSITTPWLTEKVLSELQYQQINDYVYFTHRDIPPQLLVRRNNYNWELGDLVLNTPPCESMLESEALLTFSPDTGASGASYKLQSSLPLFSYAMFDHEIVRITTFHDEQLVTPTCGVPPCFSTLNAVILADTAFCVERDGWSYCYRAIRHFVPGNYTGSDNPADYPDFFQPGVIAHDPITVQGKWSLQTFEEWTAEWALQKTQLFGSQGTPANWKSVKKLVQNSDRRQNYSISGEEEVPTALRLLLICWKTGQKTGVPELRAEECSHDHFLNIVFISDDYTAYAAPCRKPELFPLGSGSTMNWSFGAFGFRNGYPGCVEFHQGRLWFGGTRRQSQTVWGSAVDDLHNFTPGTADDAPLTLTLAASQQNNITWMLSMKGLLIGTNEGEWVLKTTDSAPVNLRNCAFERQSGLGSACRDSIQAENSAFFIQRGSNKIREFIYSLESDGYMAQDASLLAGHMLEKGVTDWTSCQAESLQIWCLLQDGTLACMTHNRSQNIVAWHPHEIAGGKVLALARLHQQDSTMDNLWMAVLRQMDGQPLVCLERISPSSLWLDCHMTLAAEQGQFSTLKHLAGMTARAIPSSNLQESVDITVDINGHALLPTPYANSSGYWTVGIPYSSEIVTMPLESAELAGIRKHQVKANILLLESCLDFSFGTGNDDDWLPFEAERHNMTSRFSGYVPVTHAHPGGRQIRLGLKTDSSGPFNILAVVPDMSLILEG